MRKEDLKNWTRDKMKDEIIILSDKNFNLEWRIKQYEESEERWKCENESLREENKSLKQRIKDLEDVCDGSCFSDEPDYRDKQIEKMEDRIDSVELRNFHFKVTIDTLVGMYAALRKQTGMD